jgi:heme o synthase
MLPVIDKDGHRTGRQAIGHTLGLLLVSLMPALLGLAGPVYMVGALILGLTFLGFAVQFSRQLTELRARQLFLASISYLPLLLGLLVLDKIK